MRSDECLADVMAGDVALLIKKRRHVHSSIRRGTFLNILEPEGCCEVNKVRVNCASETDHGSEFTTAAVKLNKMTKPFHKHRANQSGVSLKFVTLSMAEAVNGFRITCTR